MTDAETVVEFQELAEDVTVEESVRRYIIDLARETRRDDRTDIGVSPRGVQRLYELTRAVAVVEGRDYVVPDDVKRLAEAGMAHRVVLTTESTVEGVDTAAIVRDAVAAVDVPAVAPGPDEPPGATEPADTEALSTGKSEGSGEATGGQGEPAEDGTTATDGAAVTGADDRTGDQQEGLTAEGTDDQRQSEQESEPATVQGQEQTERQSSEQTE